MRAVADWTPGAAATRFKLLWPADIILCFRSEILCGEHPHQHGFSKGELFLSIKLELPAGDFRAYLFDCDGTVADSMPLHYKAWKEALAEWNCTFPEDVFYSWGGKPVSKIVADLNEMQGLKMPVEAVAVRKEALYHALLPELKGIPAVVEQVEKEYGHKRLAVVSGGRRKSVEGAMTVLGLLDKFDTLVCSEDYTHGKPAPDCFLLAAERLGVKPSDCLVFEDTQLGIDAATAAGMKHVRVPQTLSGTGETVSA
jgi:beta-phosphoglucomutase family hydrolase